MQPQQWQWQRKDIFGYIISEKGTGAEIIMSRYCFWDCNRAVSYWPFFPLSLGK